jgi:glutathione S-transferase
MFPTKDGSEERMRLYSGPLSLFSRKVEIALHEKNLDFERIEVAFTQIEGYRPKHPDVVAANPKGQVPVLVDDGLTLFDSTVILEYLEDAYPAPPLYPTDPRQKARCRLVETDADEVVFTDVRRLLYRSEPPLADAERQKARQEEGRRGEEGIAVHYRRLDEQLGAKDCLCGVFTVADIAMFMTVHFAVRLNGPRLDGFPALTAWYQRVGRRPSVTRVVKEIAEADRKLSWPLSA